MEIISVLRERAAELERAKMESLCQANYLAGALDELGKVVALISAPVVPLGEAPVEE